MTKTEMDCYVTGMQSDCGVDAHSRVFSASAQWECNHLRLCDAIEPFSRCRFPRHFLGQF